MNYSEQMMKSSTPKRLAVSLNGMAKEFLDLFPVVPELETQIDVCLEELTEVYTELTDDMGDIVDPSKINTSNMVKEMCDVIVTFQNICHVMGIDLNTALVRVHESNISKFKDASFREDGKVLKGPNYQPPVLDDLI